MSLSYIEVRIVMDVFVKKMIEVKDKIMNRMKENKDIIMRADDWRYFKTATKCFICGNDFKEGDKKKSSRHIARGS